jgi:hypothetical protein
MKITVKELRSLVKQTLTEQAAPDQIETGWPTGVKAKLKKFGYRLTKRDVTLPVYAQDFQIMASAEGEWRQATPPVREFIILLAYLSKLRYGDGSDRYVVVTDLYRDAADQVRVMYDKLKKGDSAKNVLSLYSAPSPGMSRETDDIAIQVINVLKKQDDAGVATAIAIIEDAMEESQPLSAHLIGAAVDLRSKGIEKEVGDLLSDAAEFVDIGVIDETDSQGGPHWHVTVNAIKPEGRKILDLLEDITSGVPYKPGKDDPR